MKIKTRIVLDILLVTAAVAAFAYTFYFHRTISYISAVVAVCGTVALLVRDVRTLKKKAE